MRIFGFAQLRNELIKGNLENWFKCMNSVCDKIFIFDQNSVDGSHSIYDIYGKNLTVLQSSKNLFEYENICKHSLLNQLLSDPVKPDWIFWMDGDTVLDGRLCDYQKVRDFIKSNSLNDNGEEVDEIRLGHYNLWRNSFLYRTDDQYHGLHGGVSAFWRNNGGLYFPKDLRGLHQRVVPYGLKTWKSGLPYSLIHRGFATDFQIVTKYEVYRNRGQHGWALDRLLNENGLTVERVPDEVLPSWYKAKYIYDDTGSTPSQKISDFYKQQKETNFKGYIF